MVSSLLCNLQFFKATLFRNIAGCCLTLLPFSYCLPVRRRWFSSLVKSADIYPLFNICCRRMHPIASKPQNSLVNIYSTNYKRLLVSMHTLILTYMAGHQGYAPRLLASKATLLLLQSMPHI